jgi:hypothetical protein
VSYYDLIMTSAKYNNLTTFQQNFVVTHSQLYNKEINA